MKIEDPQTGKILSETEMKRPRWEHVFLGYPDRYDNVYFERLKQLFDKNPVKSIKFRLRDGQPPNDLFESILGRSYYDGEFNNEEASAARVSIAITISPKMKYLLDKDIKERYITADAPVIEGLLGEKRYYFIADVKELKDWLSKDDVWGAPDRKIEKNVDLEAIRKEIKGKTGVCIISRPVGNTKDRYATLWTGNNVVSGHKYINKDSTVYFWELKSISSTKDELQASGHKCEVPGCGRSKEIDHIFCEHHDTHSDNASVRVIEEPIYSSLDRAAMVAANIILSHASKNGEIKVGEKRLKYSDIEYGISIYGDQTEKKFCLVETKKGDNEEVFSDYKIQSCPEGFSFIADVHSHPKSDIQMFSVADYVLSFGGRYYREIQKDIKVSILNTLSDPPHIKFIVGVHDDGRKTLTMFMPPTLQGAVDKFDSGRAKILAVIMVFLSARFYFGKYDNPMLAPFNGAYYTWKDIWDTILTQYPIVSKVLHKESHGTSGYNWVTVNAAIVAAYWVTYPTKKPKPKFNHWIQLLANAQQKFPAEYIRIKLDNTNWMAIRAAIRWKHWDEIYSKYALNASKQNKDALDIDINIWNSHWRDVQKDFTYNIIRDFGGQLQQTNILNWEEIENWKIEWINLLEKEN